MKKRRGNGSKCGVPGCNNNNSSDCFLSFFRFPPKQKYKLRFFEWCEKIGVVEGLVSPHQCICQNHFEDKYFTSKQKIRLKPHAVPTLQLSNQNSTRPATVPPKNEKRVKTQESYRTEPPILSYPSGPHPVPVPVPVPIPVPVVPLTPVKMMAADPQKPVNHGKPKCFYKYCISRRKSYVSPEPYPYIWTAPKTTDQLEWINFIRKLPPDYVKVQELASKHRFCHLHFEEHFIVKGNKYNVDGKTYEVPLSKWRLTPDAYPTLFDPQDQSRDPPRAQSEIKHTISKSGSSLAVSAQNQRQETKCPNSTSAETAHLSPPHTDNDDSLPSVNSDSVSINSNANRNNSQDTSAKSGRNSDFEGITNIEENSSSQNSFSFHDMVDMEIQVPVVLEAESEQQQRRQIKDCNKNVSRVLHTPPGDPEPDATDSVHAINRPEAVKLEPGSTCISAGAGSLFTSGHKTNAEGHAKFKSSDMHEESDRDIISQNDFDGPIITNVRGSGGIGPASGKEANKGEEKGKNVDTDDTGHLTDSSVEEIPVVLDSEAEAKEEITSSNTTSSNTTSAGNQNPNPPNPAIENKRKRKQELSSLNLNCITSKKSKSKNVEVIDLDSDGDAQSHQTTVTSTEKLRPSILKRTIAKITTEVSKQQQQQQHKHQNKPDSKLKPKAPPPTSNNSSSSSQIPKLLPAPVPNLNHQIILVRQSGPGVGVGPGQKKPLKTTGLTQQALNNSHTGPFVILGSPSLGGGPSIALPLPIPMAVPAVGGGNPPGSGPGPNKLILLRQPGESPTSNSAVDRNNSNYSNPNPNSNTKKSLVTLTARDLSFLSMPSPDWSVNTYPDIFSISETIMSQDRIEIIRKSITITSSNWLMKFSIFAHDVPAFSSGLSASMGGISEVQHVLNRFAEVPICSGLDLDSSARSTKRKYSESSVSQGRKMLRYDVDHNYRSAECLLVILKNSTHPLETNPETGTGATSANSPLRKKPYEFILCGPCQTVEKTFLRET